MVVQRVLRRAGHEVSACNDGAALIEQVRAQHPDVVVTDNDMPVTTGMQVIRALHADPDTTNIPVVLVSGSITDTDAAEVRAGGDQMVHKPFTAAQLTQGVEAALNGAHHRREREQPPA